MMTQIISRPKYQEKNKFGQYFTPEIIANFMIELADISTDSQILEPSCGDGVFLKFLERKGFHNITAFEIDKELSKEFNYVQYKSFVSSDITEKFDLIIGNPPYIRWKNLEDNLKQELSSSFFWNKYFNSLCDYSYIFILKSIELLKENGQLIFICPEYWLNTTHASSLRNYMSASGSFEKIYHFNETPIFDKVAISTIIFKYIKSKNTINTIKVAKFYANQKLNTTILENLQQEKPLEKVEYIKIKQFEKDERWILATEEIKNELYILEKACIKKVQNNKLNLFENAKLEYYTISDICDIGNGLVSGLDNVFQLPDTLILNDYEKNTLIKVIKAKDLKPFYFDNITNYIYISDCSSELELEKLYPNFYKHFQKHKEQLNNRYQYNRKINYWEWVFLRNFNLFSKPEKRIFVPCKERISNKNHFRFSLVESGLYPTQDVTAIFRKQNTKESIEYILAYLNNPKVFDWLKFNGIVKGNIIEFSEKPIASIPFKAIDWTKPNEVLLHNTITQKVNQYIQTKEQSKVQEIDKMFCELLGM